MGNISVPVQDLKDTVKELQNIGDMLENSATLDHAVGDSGDAKSVAGDDKLAEALHAFDKAWSAGYERVKDNVKKFADNTDTIAENFTQTDDDTIKSLEDDKKDA